MKYGKIQKNFRCLRNESIYRPGYFFGEVEEALLKRIKLKVGKLKRSIIIIN